MSNRFPKFAAVCFMVLFGALLASPARGEEKVTFQDHVLPIFRNACNSCHNADKKKAGLDLTSYSAAMAGSDDGAVVNSGDAAGSTLYKVVTHAMEPTMPPKRDKLAPAELETIRKWIAGGALDTANGKAAIATKPKVDLGAVVVSGKPTGPIAMPSGLTSEPIVRTERPGAVESLASSPWAPVIAVGGQKQIILYNSQTLDVLGVLPFNEGVPRVLQFSRNGNLLMAAGGEGAKLGKVVLYDVATGNRLTDVGDELDEVLAADLSPDQKIVALGGPGRIVKGYDVAEGKELYALKKHTDWVTAIAISPDGQYLASGDRAGNLYVWEAKTGGELFTLNGHKDQITTLCFRGDSNVLMSGSKDGAIYLWEMTEGKSIKNFAAHGGGVMSAEFAHDGRIVTCGRDKTVKVWDSTGATQKAMNPPFTDLAMHATFDADGRRVFAGDYTGIVRAWDLGDGKAEAKVVGEISPDPPRIADRLDAATKKLAALQPPVAQAEANLKSQMASADKCAADQKANLSAMDEAKKLIADSDAKLKSADVDAAANKAALAKAIELIAAKKGAIDAQSKVLAAAKQAAIASPTTKPSVDLQPLEAAVKEKEAGLAEATKSLAATQEALKQKNDDASKAAVADAQARVDRRAKRVAEAQAALETARKTPASPDGKPDAAKVAAAAEAQVAFDKLQGELKSAEQAQADAKTANDKIAAAKDVAGKAMLKGKADLAAADAQTKPQAAALAAALEKVVPAKKAFEGAQASVSGAAFEIAKLKASQAGSGLAEAKKAFGSRTQEKSAADEASKASAAAVEKAKADLVAFKKGRDESPAKVKTMTDQLVPLKKAVADAIPPAEAAAKEFAERDAIAKQAADLAGKIGEQAMKAADNKLLADAQATAKKVIEQLAGDLAAAKEKAAKWADGRKKAETDLAATEQAIAKEKSDTENAGKIVDGLNKAIADAEADVPKKLAVAQSAVRPVDEAKAKMTQAQAEYDRLAAEASKLAPPTAVSKS